MAWLRSLQRPDGSFGEVLGEDGLPSGIADLRYCYMAAATSYILVPQSTKGMPTIDVDRLAAFVLASQVRRPAIFPWRRKLTSRQTHDGGFARAPLLESHGARVDVVPGYG